MNTPKKNNNAAVDNILEELKGKRASTGVPGGSVDDILAEMGMGDNTHPPKMPSRPKAAASKPDDAPAGTEPSSTGTAVFRAVEKNLPRPKAGETAVFSPVRVSRKAPEPREKTQKEEQAGNPPSPIHEAPRMDKTGGTRTLPSFDIGEDTAPAGPRLGKAAAIDKVDPDKFSGDEELLSWFSSETGSEVSRSVLRKVEKERKKQKSAGEREEKRRKKKGKKEKDTEEDFWADYPIEPLMREKPQQKEPAAEPQVAVRNKEEPAIPPAGPAVAAAEPPPAPNREPRQAPQAGQASQSPVEPATRQETQPQAEASEKTASPAKTPPIGTSGRKKGTVTAVLEELGVESGKAAKDVPAARATSATPTPGAVEGNTIEMNIAQATAARRLAPETPPNERVDTQTYDAIDKEHEGRRVPTAAYTHEFPEGEEPAAPKAEKNKSLYVDEMVDASFRDFFSETVIVDREELEHSRSVPKLRRKKKSHTALITGEFARLAEQAEEEELEEFEDYNRPQDAEAVEKDILTLRTNLTRRIGFSAVMAGLLIWLGLGFSGLYELPAFIRPEESPLAFSILYLAFLVMAMVLNFTTVATGIVGIVGEPTVDSPPALAAVAALLQGVVVTVQLATGQPAVGTLFAGIAVLVLTFNCLGKRLRATAIMENFRIASAGLDHSAAYILDGGHEVAYNITNGLEEENPSILISRPTALVKGFLRQSFSQRWSDRLGRVLARVILAVAVAAGVVSYLQTQDLMQAISALAAVFCLAVPFSSTLLAAVPSRLLQASTAKVGAVVPGWSAIEELGGVNVVMAGAQDIFPPGSVQLRGIKTFEKERVDLAILYAASVLVEGCATLREVFLAVIQGKSGMLFKVENPMEEPGRGFSAWVENNRVVIGTREMLQKHGIEPPSVEMEMKSVQGGHLPVYLAVSGKLFAMFIIGYTPDAEVQETLDGLIKSGVSLLVKSEDMNVTSELIERVYQLPGGMLKVLGKRELDLLEPLQAYLPESEGAMTHMGSFASFIGGMRAAAGCAAAERMSGIVQAASVGLACLLAFLLVYSGGLATLGMGIAIIYQLGWSVLVSALPLARRY